MLKQSSRLHIRSHAIGKAYSRVLESKRIHTEDSRSVLFVNLARKIGVVYLFFLPPAGTTSPFIFRHRSAVSSFLTWCTNSINPTDEEDLINKSVHVDVFDFVLHTGPTDEVAVRDAYRRTAASVTQRGYR